MTSKVSSNDMESDPPTVQMGNAFSRSGRSSLESNDSRVRIQLRLPCTVLISPLCAMKRYGCASGHEGNVLVLKRLCTNARADSMRSSDKSGKNSPSSGVVNIPLYTKVRADNEGKYVDNSSGNSCSTRLRAINNLRSRSIPLDPCASLTNI